MARRALGRGLGALISGKPTKAADFSSATETTGDRADPAEGLVNLPLEAIQPSRHQPRKDFDQRKLKQLADSIREQGLVQPLVVHRNDAGKYELIAGERRFRAVQLLGEETVPAVVMEASDSRILEMALVENLQRDDLNPIEVAIAYKTLLDEKNCTHEEVAKRVGYTRSRVTNSLRLLDLPESIKTMVSQGDISAGHGRTILGLPDEAGQIRMANRIINERLSVRQVEALVEEWSKPAAETKGTKKKSSAAKSPHIQDLEDRLRTYLGTRVSVQDRKGKGTITIEYYTPTDITRILETIGVPGDPK